MVFRIYRIPVLLLLVTAVAARFFDSCPSRRQSIGACLAGLCPAGSECINQYCCKLKDSQTTTVTTTTVTTASPEIISVEESEEFGRCKNGLPAIGECISESCPKGYRCQEGLCCKPDLPAIIPVEKEVTKKSTTKTTANPSTSTTSRKNIVTVIPEAESEETEIESIKNSFLKKGGIDGDSNSIETTTAEEEDYEVSEREEVDDITTSTTATLTTSSTPVMSSRKRYKTRRPKTTTPEPEEETEEVDEWTTEPMRTTTMTTTTVTTEAPDTGCPVGEPIGECVSGHCPEGHACFQNFCCILTPQINCTDTLSHCMPHLCEKRGYKEFMTKGCARTCARCHLVDLTGSELQQECRDRRSDCAEWASEGFCESTLYTTRQKLKFCGKSCKLC